MSVSCHVVERLFHDPIQPEPHRLRQRPVHQVVQAFDVTRCFPVNLIQLIVIFDERLQRGYYAGRDGGRVQRVARLADVFVSYLVDEPFQFLHERVRFVPVLAQDIDGLVRFGSCHQQSRLRPPVQHVRDVLAHAQLSLSTISRRNLRSWCSCLCIFFSSSAFFSASAFSR